MSKRYDLAYERFSVHKFKDICLGKEREFELKVGGSIRIGEHKLAIAYEPNDNGTFEYIVIDGYIHVVSTDHRYEMNLSV